MNSRSDPFTRSPGIAGKAYIDNGIASEIIRSFTDSESSKYVYKITGLRGSGKSVEYGRVIRTLKNMDGWLVYPLSASGDVVSTLIARLSREKFISSKSTTTTVGSTASGSGSVGVVSGSGTVSISATTSENDHYYSEEAALIQMVECAGQNNYSVLIGIDDISKTPEVVSLLSMIGSMMLEGLNIYLIVTGLSENIEEISSEKSLSFFKRADTKEIGLLNRYDILYMYEKLLDIDSKKAKELEEVSMGYAYAYQVLGSLYFEKKDKATLDDIIPDFERILFKDSYDLIWRSLSNGDKDFLRCIYASKTGKAEDIKKLMEKPSAYQVYRSRLINKHIVDGSTHGYLSIHLPRFDKFIELWGDD